MVEIGWEQRIYPAAKIAIVVDALAAEGVPESRQLTPSAPRRSNTAAFNLASLFRGFRARLAFAHVFDWGSQRRLEHRDGRVDEMAQRIGRAPWLDVVLVLVQRALEDGEDRR